MNDVPRQDKTEDVAASYAIGDLSPEEMVAFEDRLLRGDPEATEAYVRVGAAADALLRSVPAAAEAPVAPLLPSEASERPRPARVFVIGATGWAAAAIALGFTLFMLLNPARQPPTPDVSQLLARGALPVTLEAWSGDPPPAPRLVVARDFSGAAGQAAWDTATGSGIAEVTGLPSSIGADWQYQAWVVDASRGTPVPAGVFDAASGVTVAEFEPTVAVLRPVAIAITAEPRGGVIVPDLANKVAIGSLPEPAGGGSTDPGGGP